jgi:hypothetical protein
MQAKGLRYHNYKRYQEIQLAMKDEIPLISWVLNVVKEHG